MPARRRRFDGYWHPQLGDVGSGQQLGRWDASQHLSCARGAQHSATGPFSGSVDGCVRGEAAGRSDWVLIDVSSSLIMN
jgi:hypothetical protein